MTEKKVFSFYLRLIASLFVVIVGFGVVSPALFSYPDDVMVVLGYLNTFLFSPLILYILWRDYFRD